MVSFWIASEYFCGAFPIEQFTDFINNKPTIKNFTFDVNTTKFRVEELDPSTFCHFTLTMENDEIYRLTEDERGYNWNFSPPKVDFPNIPVVPFKPPQAASWGRYGNQFWNTFNASDVITTTIDSNAIPTFGPARILFDGEYSI